MSSIQKLIYWSLGSYIVKLYSKGQMKNGLLEGTNKH